MNGYRAIRQFNQEQKRNWNVKTIINLKLLSYLGKEEM